MGCSSSNKAGRKDMRSASKVFSEKARFKNSVLVSSALASCFCFSVNASNGSFAKGNGSVARGRYSVAIGHHSEASGQYSVALGNANRSTGHASTAMGGFTKSTGHTSTAMGYYTTASGGDSTAMGESTQAKGENSLATGYYSIAEGENSTAMGYDSVAKGDGSFAMGGKAKSYGKDSVAIGKGAVAGDADNANIESVAIGYGAKATAGKAMSLGFNIENSASNTFVMGSNVKVTQKNSVILGSGSTDKKPSNGVAGVVSVGSKGSERQVVNVADGELSVTSTDAVNGRQLFAVQKMVEKLRSDMGKGSAGQGGGNSVNIGGASLKKLEEKLSQESEKMRDAMYNMGKSLSGGIAAVSAIEQAPYVPGKFTYAAGTSYYNGQFALGVNVRRTSSNGRLSFSGSLGSSVTGDFVLRAGVAGIIE